MHKSEVAERIEAMIRRCNANAVTEETSLVVRRPKVAHEYRMDAGALRIALDALNAENPPPR